MDKFNQQGEKLPEPEPDLSYDYVQDGLKQAINEMVWTALPGITTLSRAEAIACKIFALIADEHEK